MSSASNAALSMSSKTVKSDKSPDQSELRMPELLVVERPARHDVLLGRGTGPSNHEGNVLFRDIIQARVEDYIDAIIHGTKTAIAKDIIEQVKQNGGRFLRKMESDEIREARQAAIAARSSSEGSPSNCTARHVCDWASDDEDKMPEILYAVVTDEHAQIQKTKQAFRHATQKFEDERFQQEQRLAQRRASEPATVHLTSCNALNSARASTSATSGVSSPHKKRKAPSASNDSLGSSPARYRRNDHGADRRSHPANTDKGRQSNGKRPGNRRVKNNTPTLTRDQVIEQLMLAEQLTNAGNENSSDSAGAERRSVECTQTELVRAEIEQLQRVRAYRAHEELQKRHWLQQFQEEKMSAEIELLRRIDASVVETARLVQVGTTGGTDRASLLTRVAESQLGPFNAFGRDMHRATDTKIQPTSIMEAASPFTLKAATSNSEQGPDSTNLLLAAIEKRAQSVINPVAAPAGARREDAHSTQGGRISKIASRIAAYERAERERKLLRVPGDTARTLDLAREVLRRDREIRQSFCYTDASQNTPNRNLFDQGAFADELAGRNVVAAATSPVMQTVLSSDTAVGQRPSGTSSVLLPGVVPSAVSSQSAIPSTTTTLPSS